MSERHQLAAIKRGVERTAEVEKKVVDGMAAIEAEMKANAGIYPHNGGSVGMAELARRAGIDESTFYRKAETNIALKERAALWLKQLKKHETVGRMRVHKTFQQRAESWQKKYKALENQFIVVELQLQQRDAELEMLRKDYDALLEQMRTGGQGKVTPIPKEKR